MVPPTTDTPSPGGAVGGETIPRRARFTHGGPTSWGSPTRGSKLRPPWTEATPKCPQDWTRNFLEQFTPEVPQKTSQISTQDPPGSATPPSLLCGVPLGPPMPACGHPPKGVSPLFRTPTPLVWTGRGLGSPTPTPSASPGPLGILRPGHCPASTAPPGTISGAILGWDLGFFEFPTCCPHCFSRSSRFFWARASY